MFFQLQTYKVAIKLKEEFLLGYFMNDSLLDEQNITTQEYSQQIY